MAVIIPTLHPAALLRGRNEESGLAKFEQTVIADIGKALRLSRERPRWDERVIWERDSVGRLKNLFPTPEEVIEFCRNALGHPVATDSETTGEQVMAAQLMCAGFASANGTAMCVPFLKRGGSKYWAPHDEARVRWAVGQLLASRDTIKIFHNKEFDKIVYWLNGLPVAGPVECCYVDNETEFLTEHGWKKYDDVKYGMKLATVSKTGQLEYQHFFHRVSKPFEGDVFTVETAHSRAVVTDNHRMLVRPFYRQRTKPVGEWGFSRAENLGRGSDQFDVRVAFEDQQERSLVEWRDDVRLTNSFMTLLGLWITDGGLTWSRGQLQAFQIHQDPHGPAMTELRRLKSLFGLNKKRQRMWRQRKPKGKRAFQKLVTEITFWKSQGPYASKFLQWCGRYSKHRRLPSFVLRLNRGLRAALLQGLLLGDSGVVAGRRVYRTACRGLAGDVQALALSLGYSATIHWAGGCWGVTLWQQKLDRAGTGAAYESVKKRRCAVRVVCFSVPNETLVTRSRGKPAFHGNTMQMHHVIDSELPHALGYCMTRYLDARYHKDDVKGDEGWLYLDDAQLRSYNLRDSIGTRELFPVFTSELARLGPRLVALYRQECALTELMARATVRGLAVDFWRRDCERPEIPVYSADGKTIKGYQKGLGPRLRDQMNGALATLQQLAGRSSFDPMKPVQLKELLFSRLRFPVVKLSESGLHPSTDKEAMVLLALAAGTPEQKMCIKALADFKQGQKFLSTFVEGLKVTGDGRFHPTWKLLTTTGRFNSSPNCYDHETEILTPRGWVAGYQLKPDDAVAQWRDGRVEFVAPSELIFAEAQRLVMLKRQQHIDLALTEDHRCLLRHRKTGELRVFRAAEYPQDWQQLQAGLYSGPGIPFSVDEIRLAVAIQADGNTRYLNRGYLYVGFSKARKVERYEALLKRLGAQYEKVEQHNLPDRAYRCWFKVRPCALVGKIQTLLGSAKCFGDWVLKLSREQLDSFVEEVWHWDGCLTRRNYYSSSVKSNTEWVQIALALSGFRASIREYKSVTGRSNWQIDVTRKDYSLTTNVEKKIVEGRVSVWCVTVPSGFVVVRRNGRIAVSGNSQNWRKNVKAIFCAGEPRFGPNDTSPRELTGVDLAQAEMRGIAYDSNDQRLLQMYAQNLNVHTVNLAMSLRVRPPIGHKDLDPATQKHIEHMMPVLLNGLTFSQLIEMDGNALKGARTLIKNDGFGRNYGGEDEVVFSILRAARDPDTNELVFPMLKRSDVEANGIMWRKLNVGIIRWWAKKLADARQLGYYQCPISGRIRWFRGGQKKNDVLGTPIQMMIASFINERTLEIQATFDRETGGDALIVQQVHDALNADNDKSYSARAAQVMTDVLSRPIALPGHPNAVFPPDKVLHASHLDKV